MLIMPSSEASSGPSSGKKPKVKIVEMSGPVRFDLALVTVVCVLGTTLLLETNWFEALYFWSRPYEAFKLDDLLISIVFIALGATYFSVRRLYEMRRVAAAREAAEKRMEALALTDPLTGLANRRQFYAALHRRLDARALNDDSFFVLMFDLDRFKPVNDVYGHHTGDLLLQQIAGRLQAAVRPGDLVARIGGDEFAILVNQASSDDVAALAERLLAALGDAFHIDQLICHIGASLGIAAVCPDRPCTADELMHRADQALYRAKAEGRGTYRFFEPEMDARAQERTLLEIDLAGAVQRGEIHPYYQPLVRLRDGVVEGYEILARWQHPKRGLVPPEVFIGIAEDLGLIGDISMAILEAACRHGRRWPADTYLSFNVSPVQLRDPHLCDRICDILDRTGFAPGNVQVEITENALAHDIDAARDMLMAMRERGIQLAMDDFGTGSSSLKHLRTLPFDKLKIDQSFVASMMACDESRKIVKAIIALSHSLGMSVTAEGVETHGQALKLTQLRCETGQGYLFGRPSPDTDVNTLRQVG